MAVRIDSKYRSDEGDIHSVRLTPGIAEIAGTAPTDDTTSDVSVKISRAKGEYGIKPRRVRGSAIIGTGADAYRRYITVPVLTPTDFDSAEFAKGASLTYDGRVYKIVTRLKESQK